MTLTDRERQDQEASETNAARLSVPLRGGESTSPVRDGGTTCDSDVFYAMSRCSPEWQNTEARVSDAARLGVPLRGCDSTLPLRHDGTTSENDAFDAMSRCSPEALPLPVFHSREPSDTRARADARSSDGLMVDATLENGGSMPLPAFLSREPYDTGALHAEVVTDARSSDGLMIPATLHVLRMV
eukprot:TRINITY_DN14194_c0_g1_i2.p1 TRINITY_DN14194_c0_g1~~TRINITY_DN14194_c0_g1_i2.p1  ORF type:complete len:185 (-),score=19.96 TRINITY_DN14194_c0_g1_i2:764-1318(-)